MPMTRRLLLACCVLFALVGCATERRAPELSRVELGMTEEQVRAVAGAPADVTRAPCYPDTPAYFVYAGSVESMTSYVLFHGDQVAQVVVDGRVLASVPESKLAAVCSGGSQPPG
jgi:hypothetical protein